MGLFALGLRVETTQNVFYYLHIPFFRTWESKASIYA
jgi:hypothetical protein